MKEVILDTSFILSCARQKIDFFERIAHEGMKAVIPLQTIKELEGLGAETALKIIKKNEFETINKSGKDADTAILKIAKENPSAIIATLDQGLQKKLRNPKMIIRGRKKLEII
jgi:rRNA-processing protein FCF1